MAVDRTKVDQLIAAIEENVTYFRGLDIDDKIDYVFEVGDALVGTDVTAIWNELGPLSGGSLEMVMDAIKEVFAQIIKSKVGDE